MLRPESLLTMVNQTNNELNKKYTPSKIKPYILFETLMAFTSAGLLSAFFYYVVVVITIALWDIYAGLVLFPQK